MPPAGLEQAPAVATGLVLGAFMVLEVWAAPLALGTLSPAWCWALAWAALPFMPLSGGLTCLFSVMLIRALVWPASTHGAWKDALVDFLPCLLAALLVHRFGWWTSSVALLLLALPFSMFLSSVLAPGSQAASNRWALRLEHLALLALSPALTALLGLHPALGLLLWPSVLALLRSASQGDELMQRRRQHIELRRERKRVSLQGQINEQTEARQEQQQRLLDARAETFAMLETLAARSFNQVQAVGEVVQALRQRNPAWNWHFYPEGQVTGEVELVMRVRQVWAEGAPWILRQPGFSQAAWRLSGSGVFYLQASVFLETETTHTLGVFFFYLELCFERIRSQERLVLSLQRLQALIQGAAGLAALVSPREILEYLVERAQGWTGRVCGAQFGSIEVGTAQPGQLPMGAATFTINTEKMDPSELEALRLWLVLGSGAIERCQTQATLHQNSKLAAIGQLAAGVAHELNTPLGSISMGLSLARQNLTKNPEKALSRLDTARKSVEQMGAIISKLLNFSRSSEGQLQELRLEEVLENAVQLVGHSYELESVRLDVGQLTAETWIKGNSGELQQVFVNLLVNARIAVQGRPDALVRVRCQGHVASVEDNGPGVSEQNQEKIFEPFFTTRSVGEGVGLGLSISREIVVAHHGTLSLRRSELGGACFEVALPCASAE